MPVVKCPYCGKPAMGLARKASLGPGRVLACQSCGRGVAAHWTAILAAAPAFLGGYAFLKSESVILGIAAVVAGVLTMALLQTFVVPLARTE